MYVQDLLMTAQTVSASSDGKTWVPCRPQTAENTFWWLRIKAAWRVLTGKSDAVEWGSRT